MKKPLKVLSNASLAAIFTASALVPTAAVDASESIPKEALEMDVVVTKSVDEKLAYLPYDDFLDAYFSGVQGTEEITHIGSKDESRYDYTDFLDAYFAADQTFEGAFETLYKGNSQVDSSEIYEGYVKDGKLYAKVDEQPSEVNKDALNDAIAKAEALEGEQAEAVAEALAEAKSVLEDDEATQEEVDAAAEALNKAITEATGEEPAEVNKDALNEAIAKAEALEGEQAEAVAEALAKAKEVAENDEATQEEVDAAAEALNKAIADATEEPAEDKIAVASVEAVNKDAANEVTVTFPEAAEGEEVTAEDLANTKIKLKDADGKEVVATFKELTEDGKAIYETEEDLKDAATYEVTSEDLAIAEGTTLRAEVKEPTATTFTKASETLAATTKDNKNVVIPVNAFDQYGKEIDAPESSVTIKNAKLNGMPLKATGDTAEIAYADGKVTVTGMTVEKGDVIEFDLVANDTTSSFKYDDISDEPAAIKKVEVTATSEDKEVTTDKQVPADKEITFTAAGFDQYNNPIGTEYRWVVTDGEKVVAESSKDDATFTWTPEEQGDYTIIAYSKDDTKVKGSFKLAVGHAELNELTVTKEKNLKGNNNEEIKLGTIAPNTGAVLTPEMIKFKVVKDSKAVNAADVADLLDIKVVSELNEEDEENPVEELVIKAVTKEAGTYKVTPYVEQKAEDGTVTELKDKVNADITFTTTVKEEIKTISDLTFDEKELKVGTILEKEIEFKNEHGEKVLGSVEGADERPIVTVTSSNNDIKAKLVDTKDEDGNDIQVIRIDPEKPGTTMLTIQSGDQIKSYKLTFKAATLSKIDAGQDIKGTVAGDNEDKAVYNHLTFADQDGVAIKDYDTDTLEISVKGPKGEVEEANELVEIVKGSIDEEGKVTEAEDGALDFVKVLPTDKLAEGTYTVTIANGTDKDAEDYVSASFKVEVGAVRDVANIEVVPETSTMAYNATNTFTINLFDQYEEAFALEDEDLPTVEVKTEEGETAGLEIVNIQKSTDEKAVGQYTFEAKSSVEVGDYTIVVSVPTKEEIEAGQEAKTVEKEITVKVVNGATVVDSLEIIGDNIKDGKAQYQYKANTEETDAKEIELLAKDAEGNVINIAGDAELKWTSSNDAVAKVENGKIITGSVPTGEDEKDPATVTLTADYYGKTATIEIEVSNKDSVIDAESVKLLQDLDGKAQEVTAVVLNKDSEDGTVLLRLEGTDQYGDVNKNVTPTMAQSFDPASFDATIAKEDDKDYVKVTAKKAGKGEARIQVAGTDIKFNVEVTEEAADQAAVAEAVKTLEEKAENFKTLEVNDATDEDQKKQAVKAEAEKHVTDGVTVTKVEKASETRTADAADEDEATVETETYLVTLEKNKASKVVEVEAAFDLTDKAQNTATVKAALDKVKDEYELVSGAELEAKIQEEVGEDVTVTVDALEDNEENTHKVTLTAGEGADQATLTKNVTVTEIFEATKATLVEVKEETTKEAAKAAKATIGSVEFEAKTAGTEGNNIEIEIKQGTATSTEDPVETSVAVENNKVTITLGATWNEDTSTPKLVTVQELVTLINGEDSPVKDLIQASVIDNKQDEAVTVTESAITLQDGSAATTETVTKSKTLEVTFSEAVELEGNFVLTLKDGKTATVAVDEGAVTAAREVVTIKLDVNSTIEANDTIDSIEGVTVEGKKLKLENLTVTAGE